MSEPSHKDRFPDEEPDFGDPDFYVDPYNPDSNPYNPRDEITGSLPSMDQDEKFDRSHPDEAKRIETEVAKKHVDPKNLNRDIRRNGGRASFGGH